MHWYATHTGSAGRDENYNIGPVATTPAECSLSRHFSSNLCSTRTFSAVRRSRSRNYPAVLWLLSYSGLPLLLLLSVSLNNCGAVAQFRNEQDPEYYRHEDPNQAHRGWLPYTTPNPGLGGYRSGDTYHGTNRRYGHYDDPNEQRGYDNRYENENRYSDVLRYGGDGRYLTPGRYDSRGRLRPGYDDRTSMLDGDQQNREIGVLEHWRPDLQGEMRPGKVPGVHLPLAENLFVTSNSGKIQGFYVYLYDMPGLRFNEWPVNLPLDLHKHYLNVSVFLGIPYAQPPVLEGRFKPPRRVQNWYSTWQALDFRPACPQNLKYVGASNGIRNGVHEDCLYLNIYTPSVAINVRDPYPVMFYIHGGDFDHGASNLFPGHMLAAWGQVVVVTINYRLGALGFLSTGDENSPGNYGLLDMSLALEWVYQNIRLFNGDQERITVFGPGAGGAAAGLLAVLPKTRTYVRQFISSSGSPLADWAALDDVYRVQNTSRVYGLEVGCNVESSYKLLQCLMRRNYEELAAAPIRPDVGTFAWSPVVDRNFTVPTNEQYEDWQESDWRAMPESPLRMLWSNLHHPQLRVMAGVNRDEAANMVYDDPRLTAANHLVTEEFFNKRIKEWVKSYNYSLNLEGTYDAIKWMYTFWPDPHNTTHIRDQYVNMLSDALYKSGIDQLVKELVNSTGRTTVPCYYYLLNTTLEGLKLPFWREVPGNLEYYFLSGAPFMDPDFYPENLRLSRHQFSEGDRNISQFMMKTFANFAKWGNPTQVQVSVLEAKWEPVLEGTLRYLSINNTFNTTMHYNYRQPQNTFWYHYIPLVAREWIPTPPPPRDPWTDMTEPVTAAMYSFIAVTVALLVILCICAGLWKSANRQRNKALDDLQYYSMDNLVEEQHNYDDGVRKYLERLPSSGGGRSNGTTAQVTRSTTPVTLLTTADTTHHTDSRSASPNGLLNGGVAALPETDGRSQKSVKTAGAADDGGVQAGSPYSHRKAFSEGGNHTLRTTTPSSVAQYSDGVYVGTTHGTAGRSKTPTGTLERSPGTKYKAYKPKSQPAVNVNQPYEPADDYPTLPANYAMDSRSVPNMAYMSNHSNKSSSSEGSSRSNKPLNPHSPQPQPVIVQLEQLQQQQQQQQHQQQQQQQQLQQHQQQQQQQQQHLFNNKSSDNWENQQHNQNHLQNQQQPIQQPIFQNQQMLYQQQQQQQQPPANQPYYQQIGIPVLPMQPTRRQQQYVPDQQQYLPDQQQYVPDQQQYLPDQQQYVPDQHQYVPEGHQSPLYQQPHAYTPHSQHQDPLMHFDPLLQAAPPVCAPQSPPHQHPVAPTPPPDATQASTFTQAAPPQLPLPLPRSSLPVENGAAQGFTGALLGGEDLRGSPDAEAAPPSGAASRSRPITPSSMTFEISMKNSKTKHTLPAKVINTEL